MKEGDYEIYNSLRSGEKQLTEIYLGSVFYLWRYAVGQFQAVCTESIPLNLFEKAICGILNVDGKCGKEHIGEVLGLNIKGDPEKMIFKDEAEEEILSENLDTLLKFKMIGSDDQYYSHVWLTEIGKEYYGYEKKFLKGLNKTFKIFFDLTTHHHNQARQVFSQFNREGKRCTIPEELNNEKLIKSFAQDQIPSIYDQQAGNSFTDMDFNQYTEYSVEVPICVLYNVAQKCLRLVPCPSSPINKEYVQKWLETEDIRQDVIDKFFEEYSSDTPIVVEDDQREFEKELINLQSDVDTLLGDKKTAEAIKKVTDFERKSKIIEGLNLYNVLALEVANGINEVYFNCAEFSESDKSRIEKLLVNNATKLYVAGQCSESMNVRDGMFLADSEGGEEVFGLKDCKIVASTLNFDIEGRSVTIKCYKRVNCDTSKVNLEIKSIVAKRYLPLYIDSYEKTLTSSVELNEKMLERIEGIRTQITNFDATVESLGYSEKLAKLNNTTEDLAKKIKNKMFDELSARLTKFEEINFDELETLEDLELNKQEIEEIKNIFNTNVNNGISDDTEFLDRQEAVKLKIEDLKTKIGKREKYLKNEKLPKIYVIDTNIFLRFPTILEELKKNDKRDRIVVSFKVLDELDNLKIKFFDAKVKKNLRIAIKSLNENLKMKRIEMERSDINILPDEFHRNNADYMILSVAYKHKDENVVLLTEDKNLQTISLALGITSRSMLETKREK